MKVLKRKRLLLMLSLPLVLIMAGIVWSMVSKIDAGPASYPIRLLEVTEDGASQLSSLKTGLTDFTVVTMSMKRFVALRDDLDGQYDGIYIGKGTYSPVTLGNLKDKDPSVRSKAMNTSAVQNDITRLRADDITKLFIDKGLYVIFHEQTFLNQEKSGASKGILYEAFNPLRSSTAKKSNVLFLNDNGLTDFFNGLKTDSSILKQRPQLEITNSSEIKNYVPASTDGKIYVPGDKLKFNFSVGNTIDLENHPLTAKLYINLDKSIAMSEQQVVASVKVNKATGTLEYTLPRTFSGLLYWKLEISNPTSTLQLKDYERGSIRYRNEKTVVKVLQVTPAGTGTIPESSLKKTVNMNQDYLASTDYSLDITVMTMDEFNSYVENTYTKTQNYGLNGVYDMLLFGFRDEYYLKAIMKTRSIEAVENFIGISHQSVMFTHDTVINLYGANTWVNNFKEITGQKDPVVNLGHNALNPSTKVKPVNDGLLMQYPFYLSQQNSDGAQTSIDVPKVAKTHNQYFTLDLEDPTVVPWYNIISEPSNTDQRTPDDSWNHYYTYSKSNVTYSGTGHLFGSGLSSSEAVFPVWEQKLFVNTMYRAFMGSNHAPKITVYAPDSGTVIPSYQDKLTVSYSVADLDLKDRSVTTSLKFIVKGTELTSPDYIIKDRRVGSEETITQTFRNPLSESGDIQIVITAQDDQGASASPVTIPLTVKKVDSSLSISRSQSATKIGRDKTVTIDYSITPKTLPLTEVQPPHQGKDNLVISNLRYEETFAPNLEISKEALPQGFTRTGSLTEGYTITATFDDIKFLLTTVDGVKYYKPVNPNSTVDPLIYKFTLSFIPKAAQKYVLDNSSITFDEIHAVAEPVTTATASPTAVATVAATATATATPTPTPIPTPVPIVDAFDPSVSTTGSTLGLAGDFNIFALKNIDISIGNLNVDGNVAAGWDITMGNKSGGVVIKPKGIMIAGQDFTYNSNSGSDTGIEINADITYGRNFNNNVRSLSNIHGDIKQGNPINFDKTAAYLKALSVHLNTLSPAVSTKPVNGLLVFEGQRADYNVFKVSADDIKPGGMKFKIPKSSIAIVNIIGDSPQFTNIWYDFGETDSSHILYNFPNASTLRTEGTFYGNFLAPLAIMRSDSTNITGSIIVESFSVPGTLGGSMNAHLATLKGTLPLPAATAVPTAVPTATPVATATVTATPAPTTAVATQTVAPTVTPAPLISVTLTFTRVDLEVIIEITKITVRDETILVDSPLSLQSLVTAIEPSDVEEKNKKPLWTIVSGSNIIEFTSDGVIKGIAAGQAKVTATAQDGSNVISNTATITVNPLTPPEPIREITLTGDNSGTVNSSIDFTASYTSQPVETGISYSWTVTDADDNVVNHYLTTTGPASPIGAFNASQSGKYTITVTAYSNSNTAGTPASKIVTITNPLTDFTIEGAGSVFVGKSIELNLKNFVPNNADIVPFKWDLVGDGIQFASLTKASTDTNDTKYNLTGIAPKDNITISVTAGGITRTKPIKIETLVLTDMQFTGTIVEMNVGDSRYLDQLLWFSPREIVLDDVRNQLNWESTFSGIASFQTPVDSSNRGKIYAHKSGSTLVTVQYANNPLIKATILVKVNPLDTDDRY
ncbi:DUF5057 domain-containing protein [Paenibacillus borealis]|uniref:DUF5057 domain-containing protein n=1 Tax=Paenibacillus borealis TaxID=160799 RepID=UPI00069380A5|nr:DUF5057 domain-containing protein [Paenibacillus borealis]